MATNVSAMTAPAGREGQRDAEGAIEPLADRGRCGRRRAAARRRRRPAAAPSAAAPARARGCGRENARAPAPRPAARRRRPRGDRAEGADERQAQRREHAGGREVGRQVAPRRRARRGRRPAGPGRPRRSPPAARTPPGRGAPSRAWRAPRARRLAGAGGRRHGRRPLSSSSAGPSVSRASLGRRSEAGLLQQGLGVRAQHEGHELPCQAGVPGVPDGGDGVGGRGLGGSRQRDAVGPCRRRSWRRSHRRSRRRPRPARRCSRPRSPAARWRPRSSGPWRSSPRQGWHRDWRAPLRV